VFCVGERTRLHGNGLETMKPYYQDDLVTLYHGDALEVTNWLDADVLVTDPPYGMSYQSGRKKQKPIVGDSTLNVRNNALKMWGNKPALVFGTWKQPRPANVKQLIVWDKRGGAGFSGDLNMPWADITEEIYVLGNGWTGKRRPAIYSVATLPTTNRPNHPTPKPIGLLEQLLEYVPNNSLVADPFAGSGTTLLAAKNLGITAIGIEIDEQYCELTANRLGQEVFDFGVI